ncbi:MAG: glycosyltransferase family 2 protein [Patescibacteria group bacterium]
MKQMISIVIPCHNEEEGIEHVLDNIPQAKLDRLGYETEVLVVDNNSTDNTVTLAKGKGARVIHEDKQGKGCALITGFQSVDPDTTFIVTMDGDDTYKGHEIIRMIEPLEHDFCDIVVGSRLGGKMHDAALVLHHRLANWAFTFLVRQFYNANITDTLSGYFSFKKNALLELIPHLDSTDFSIEMEMITKAKKIGLDLHSVPITYDRRRGQSKLESYADGMKILNTFFRNTMWRP